MMDSGPTHWTLDPAKFRDPDHTADGSKRAEVTFGRLRTLRINTGTLCNITCRNCYIESSPKNDRLVYITAAEVTEYLDEIQKRAMGTEEIGFTGGEPPMNPGIIPMVEDALSRGFRVMVLTNAMKPMSATSGRLLPGAQALAHCPRLVSLAPGARAM
jgi:sulfatase maturation enzyme AslB (radical SAM superfamily)